MTCPTGKKPYDTATQAHRALGAVRARHRPESSAYRCPHCPAWHLTSTPDRSRGRKRTLR